MVSTNWEAVGDGDHNGDGNSDIVWYNSASGVTWMHLMLGTEVDDSKGVSIIGTGMQNSPGYASWMFSALSEAKINIQLISTSEIRITCIIDETMVEAAVRALHHVFELEISD